MHVSNRSLLRPFVISALAIATAMAGAQVVPRTVAKALAPAVGSGASDQAKADALAKRNDRSRGFIENKGQWPAEVLFLGRSNGLDMWLTREGLKLDAYVSADEASAGHVVGIQFQGASKLSATGRSPRTVRTDFVGYERDARNAKTYGEVLSRDLYPRITLKSYFDGMRPRYDFILAPGAKPDAIRMKLVSAQGFKAEGQRLEIKTSIGSIIQQGLAAYQVVDGKQKPVRVSFRALSKDTYGFKLGPYDRSRSLVIDPLIYGSYYGGDSGQDEVHAVVSDLLGGVYMAGSTRSPDYPAIYGPYSFQLNKGFGADARDAFVSKLAGDAYRHDYAIFLGGTKEDTADFLQLDQFGNVWVAGYTESPDFADSISPVNVQYLYFDELESKGEDPNGAGRFRVGLPGAGTAWSEYISWNAPAAVVQDAINNYLAAAYPGQGLTATVESSGNVGDNVVEAPLGFKITLPSSIRGEFNVDNHSLGAFYTSANFGTDSGRAQVISAVEGALPNTGQYYLTLQYQRGGQSYVARTVNLAYNATTATVQAALNNIAADPADPDQSAVVTGVIVRTDDQTNTGTLPQRPYVVLFPQNQGSLIFNNVSMNNPYVIARTGVSILYWDENSSTPTGGGAIPGGFDYNANGGAFNLAFGNRWTATPVPYNTDAQKLSERLGTINTIGDDKVVIAIPNGAMPNSAMAVVAVKDLLGASIPLVVRNDQVIQGGPLGITPPVMLSEGRIAPGSRYRVRSESRAFLMRFSQDAGTTLNPKPTKLFFFGGEVAPLLTGFRIIPHDNPVAGEAIRFAFSGTVFDTFQVVPEVPGSPRMFPAGFILRVNYTEAGGFGVVNGASGYVDSAGSGVYVTGIDVDPNANVYVSGTIRGPFGNTIDTAVNPDYFQTTPVDSTSYLREGRLLRYWDGFVRKYSSAGALTYSVLVGGDGPDEGFGVAVDANNNAYLLGRSRSFNYPRTRGVYGETFTQDTRSTVAKLNTSATDVIYSTHLRTGGTVTPVGIAVDSRGVAYCTFTVSRGTIFNPWTPDNDPNLCAGFEVVGSVPTTADAVRATYAQPGGGDFGSQDGAILALNPSATGLMFGTYLGGDLDDTVYRPFVDKGGDLWVCGYTDTFRAYIRTGAWRPTIRRFQVKTQLPATMITPLAFRPTPKPNQGYGSSGSQLNPWQIYNTEADTEPIYWSSYRDREGYVQRFRIGLTSVQSVAFNPTTIAGGLGAASTGVVTLSQAAPAGGASIVLTMSGSAPASFANGSHVSTTSITIPAGQRTGAFTVYSEPVPDNTPVDVTATYQGNFKVGRLVITPWLQSFSITPQEVVGGNTVAGRIQLAFPAGSGGMNVQVSADKPTVATVTNVTVPAGQNALVFNINTNGVDADTTVTITASLQGIGKAFQLVVKPAQLKSLTFNPASVTSGTASTGTLTLNGKAGPQGFTVLVSVQGSPPGYVVAPASLKFANGDTTKTFVVYTPYEDATVPRVVSAAMQPNLGYTPNTITGTLTVNAIAVTDLTITPATVAGGGTAKGQITLSAPALAGGAKVDIAVSPNNGVVTVPSQITVPAGQTTATFDIPTTTLITNTTYTITASRGSSTDSATLTVQALTFGLTVPAVIPGGSSGTGSINLSGPAPAGGIAVKLTSSNPTLVSVADTVTIPGGSSSVTFPINAGNVSVDTSVTISAKIGTTTQAQSLLVTASKLVGMTISPSYVLNLRSTTITLKLNGPAPSGGLVVNLTNSNPFIVGVPSRIVIPAGKTSYSFSVLTYRVTRTLTATISGTSQNGGAANALITVHN